MQMSHRESKDDSLRAFSSKAKLFLKNTESFVREGVNPGDYYKAVWCRDASYILKDWFLAGDLGGTMQAIHFIWSHQIEPGKEKIVFGRGSPDMNFLSQVANRKEEKQFEGALPSTIFDDFSEVYAKNPDIDSTALMVSTTSWILDNYLRAGLLAETSGKEEKQRKARLSPKTRTKESSLARLSPKEVIEFSVPRMERAIGYLKTRDQDKDGLLEQDHNEDWMDTVLRAGKIVYSQACWILALTNLSSLLLELEKKHEADRMARLADAAILAVEKHLWSDVEGCYMDKQVSHHLGREYKTLTQDVALYIVAVTEKTVHDTLGSLAGRNKRGAKTSRRPIRSKAEFTSDGVMHGRAVKTLDAIENRIWKDRWPLVTEAEMKTTRPWILKPNEYHNRTFWPWTTGIEMLARSRLKQFGDCNTLLSFLTLGKQAKTLAFYEWVNPLNGKGSGAHPFRTGISTIRVSLIDILAGLQQQAHT
jgi:hypothetical protein